MSAERKDVNPKDSLAKDSQQATAEPSAGTRRNFLKATVLGAGVTAALGGARVAPAQAAAAGGITVPKAIEDRAKAPLPEIGFPNMTGADVFARAMKDEGVAALFCCPGNYEVIHATADQGIPVYTGRNEGWMCSAADAFIRVTGQVAATSGTEGPGFAMMISSIAAAKACRTPLLVLASNRSVALDDTERSIQVMYQQPLTEGIKKYGKRLVSANRVHEYAGYAFRQLKTGIPGPVHIDFTTDVTRVKFKSEKDLALHVDKGRYRTESRPAPSAADVRKAVEMIRQAKRPMIVASTGVFYNKAWDALRMFAEKAQIPVTESGPMRGQFSDSHPLSASAAPMAYPSTDLVILVGQYCMPAMGEFAFGPDAKYIRIEPEGGDIGRNIPIDLGIVSDEREAMEALYEAVPKMDREVWLGEIAAARQKFDEQSDAYYKMGVSYTDAVHPAVIGKELGDFLHAGDLPREQTTVVSGGFGIARYTRRWLRAHRPAQICNGAYQFGAIGPDVAYAVGVGAAVQMGTGPQAAYKGHPIICITGDAGFGYSAMEIETLAKYRMPAVIIVYNNNAWGTVVQATNEGTHVPLHLFQENLRYEKIAEGLGGAGEYVTAPDQFKPALERAYALAAKERIPVVVNCQAKKEFWFRDKYQPGFLGKVEPGVLAYYH